MRPFIGITSELGRNSLGQPQSHLNAAYSRAVVEAGAAPLVIPSDTDPDACASLVSGLDGILLSGGGDIEPWRYQGNPAAPLIEVSAARDELELGLVRLAAELGKPFLGICRGCQVVNVALGGSLYEDLDTEPGSGVRHNVPGKESPVPAHDVRVEAGSLLAQVLDRVELGVNSHHHQGLRNIPTTLRISARAPDGLAEAVELPEHPFGLALQWHPEWLIHQEWTRRLFTAFVLAAGRQR
jgi:putative glutamine amidotransferase